MADDPMRTRILEHPVDLSARQASVQRNGNHAQYAARINELDVVGPVRQQQSQTVSRPKTVAGERGCNAFYPSMEFGKGQESTVTNKRSSAGIESQCPAESMNIDHLLLSFLLRAFCVCFLLSSHHPSGYRPNRPQRLPRRIRFS